MSSNDCLQAAEAKEEVKDDAADVRQDQEKQEEEDEEIPQLVPIATPSKKPKQKVSDIPNSTFLKVIEAFQLEYCLTPPPPLLVSASRNPLRSSSWRKRPNPL